MDWVIEGVACLILNAGEMVCSISKNFDPHMFINHMKICALSFIYHVVSSYAGRSYLYITTSKPHSPRAKLVKKKASKILILMSIVRAVMITPWWMNTAMKNEIQAASWENGTYRHKQMAETQNSLDMMQRNWSKLSFYNFNTKIPQNLSTIAAHGDDFAWPAHLCRPIKVFPIRTYNLKHNFACFGLFNVCIKWQILITWEKFFVIAPWKMRSN